MMWLSENVIVNEQTLLLDYIIITMPQAYKSRLNT